MTIWLPSKDIQVKVLGLVWHGERLLAAEIEDDLGRVKGIRPLGGSIEFGETREQALAREFAEELGCDITITGAWLSLENIYCHENVPGHEYVFAANIRLHNVALYKQEEIQFVERNGTPFIARWFVPGYLPEGVALFPSGLAPMLQRPL
jgi:hypothetical protein